MERIVRAFVIVALVVSAIALLDVLVCEAEADLVPATITTTNFTDTTSISQVGGGYIQGDSLRFTNCVVYAGSSTNSARQDLTDITVRVTLGSGTSVTSVTGWVESTNGIYGANFARCPSNDPCYMQLNLTHTNGTSRTYWQQKTTTDKRLGD